MSDERLGLPSASSAQRYALCPGSFLLEKQSPPVEETQDATDGTIIHEALALDRSPDTLTESQRKVYEMCAAASRRLCSGRGDARCVDYERRLFNHSGSFSGKPDVAVDYGNGTGVIIDFKTGRNEVERAAGNMQLRWLAVLAAQNYGLSEVTVAIIQPLAGDPSVCTYTAEDLAQAEAECDAIIAALYEPNAPRNPSLEACKYCKAKAICPEAQAAAMDVATPLRNVPEGTTPDAIAATLTGPHLAEFLKRSKLAEAVIDACRAEAKRRLAEGQDVPGFTLKPGRIQEKITNPTEVFNRFVKLGGSEEAFLACVTIGKEKLKTAVKTATTLKGKGLDAAFDALLDNCTETKQTAQTLEEV